MIVLEIFRGVVSSFTSPKDIYMVNTPFQYMSALNAKNEGVYNHLLLFVSGFHKKNDEQLLNLIDKSKWDKITIYKPGILMPDLYKLILIFIIRLSSFNVRRIISGDPRTLCHYILLDKHKDRAYAIDDGAFSLNLHIPELKKRLLEPERMWGSRWELKILRTLIDIDQVTTSLKLLSIFKFMPESSDVTLMDFNISKICDALPTRKHPLSLHVENKGVFIIGGPYCEVGLMTQEQYDCILDFIITREGNSTELTYICHRSESNNKIQHIKRKYKNIKLVELDRPVELFFAYHKGQCDIYGLYSTCLFTLSYMLTNIENHKIFSLRVNADGFLNNKSIQLVYKALEEEGRVQVIPVDIEDAVQTKRNVLVSAYKVKDSMSWFEFFFSGVTLFVIRRYYRFINGRRFREWRKSYFTWRVKSKAGSYGKGLTINNHSPVTDNTHLGSNVHSNGLEVQGQGSVYIGNNFHCGEHCLIITSNHNYDEGVALPYDNTYVSKDVIIEDQVWLGRGVTILSGVKIGEGAIIQAGSVVVSDIPKCAIAGGHPAKVFKYRDLAHYERLKEEGQFC